MKPNEKQELATLSDEIIVDSIYFIRGRKVMIDRDLAAIYEVETRVLNQAVRRNVKRFPEDFMFQLTNEEFTEWKSQIVMSNADKMGLRKPPLAFTEQGVAMLSSVLNSENAIMANIQIIRVFAKTRKMLAAHQEILRKLEMIERKDIEQDEKIMFIFKCLKQLEQAIKQEEIEEKKRQPIGFRVKRD